MMESTNESKVRFLRESGDTGYWDHAARSQRIEVPAPPRQEHVSFELGEVLGFIGLGAALGSFWTWMLLGVWVR